MKFYEFTRWPSSRSPPPPRETAELPLPGCARTPPHWMQAPRAAVLSLSQGFEPLSCLTTAGDSRKALSFLLPTSRGRWVSLPLCKMRRPHYKTLLELTFPEWNFPNCPLLWAEQSTFSSHGNAVEPSRGFLLVPITQGRDLSEHLLSLKGSGRSRHLELS